MIYIKHPKYRMGVSTYFFYLILSLDLSTPLTPILHSRVAWEGDGGVVGRRCTFFTMRMCGSLSTPLSRGGCLVVL